MKFLKISQQGVGSSASEEANFSSDNVQFEKLCSNDKVIQSIKDLIEKNSEEKGLLQTKFKDLQFNLKCMNAEVEQLNRQLEELDKKEQDILKQINDLI